MPVVEGTTPTISSGVLSSLTTRPITPGSAPNIERHVPSPSTSSSRSPPSSDGMSVRPATGVTPMTLKNDGVTCATLIWRGSVPLVRFICARRLE